MADVLGLFRYVNSNCRRVEERQANTDSHWYFCRNWPEKGLHQRWHRYVLSIFKHIWWLEKASPLSNSVVFWHTVFCCDWSQRSWAV